MSIPINSEESKIATETKEIIAKGPSLRKDLFKMGAYLDKIDFFAAHPKVKFYWWFLALLTPVIQINFICKIGIPIIQKRFIIGNDWVEEEKESQMWKTCYCEGAKIDNIFVMFLFTCLITKSQFQKGQMLLVQDLPWIHIWFMTLQMIIVTFLSTWVILQMQLELIEIPDVLAKFVGLMVIFNIDVTTGYIFETLLDNKYKAYVSNADEYLVFEIKSDDKNAVFIYVMFFNVLTYLLCITGWILYKFDYCPNYDKQMKFAEENPDYGWTELATGGYKIVFVTWQTLGVITSFVCFLPHPIIHLIKYVQEKMKSKNSTTNEIVPDQIPSSASIKNPKKTIQTE